MGVGPLVAFLAVQTVAVRGACIVAGGVAVGLPPSIWLLSFSGFLFLSLAFLKRFIEVRGADAVPSGLTCALPAIWKGIFYDERALETAWGLVWRQISTRREMKPFSRPSEMLEFAKIAEMTGEQPIAARIIAAMPASSG